MPEGAGKHDIYLAPHSDDACFSLGHLARKCAAGTLMTVFSVTGYRAGGKALDPTLIRGVTQQRMAEDAAFASACGLSPQWLGLPDAFARGRPPFDAALAGKLVENIADAVLRAILAPTIGRRPQPRPWLYCPAGIGGHVDHIALAMLVLSKLDALTPHYRIAFYEDLHYASKADHRLACIDCLAKLASSRGLERRAIFFADEASQNAKMDLVRLYPSQLTPRLNALQAYIPALETSTEAHEAVWVLQDDAHQRPG